MLSNIQKTLLIALFSSYISICVAQVDVLPNEEVDVWETYEDEEISEGISVYNTSIIIAIVLLIIIGISIFYYCRPQKIAPSPKKKIKKDIEDTDICSEYCDSLGDEQEKRLLEDKENEEKNSYAGIGASDVSEDEQDYISDENKTVFISQEETNKKSAIKEKTPPIKNQLPEEPSNKNLFIQKRKIPQIRMFPKSPSFSIAISGSSSSSASLTPPSSIHTNMSFEVSRGT